MIVELTVKMQHNLKVVVLDNAATFGMKLEVIINSSIFLNYFIIFFVNF